MTNDIWDNWNAGGGTKYPQEKVIQYCFRNFPADQRKNIRALDLGCGSGVHTVFLASEGFQVTGTDKSEIGIENTRRKLADLGLQATLRVESADKVDFPPDSFDLILCVGIYDSAGPAVAKASVARVRQVLKVGGRGFFLFSSDRDSSVHGENPWSFHGYTREEVEKLFSEGFGKVWIDRYITTYENGRVEQNEWIVTVQR